MDLLYKNGDSGFLLLGMSLLYLSCLLVSVFYSANFFIGVGIIGLLAFTVLITAFSSVMLLRLHVRSQLNASSDIAVIIRAFRGAVLLLAASVYSYIALDILRNDPFGSVATTFAFIGLIISLPLLQLCISSSSAEGFSFRSRWCYYLPLDLSIIS